MKKLNFNDRVKVKLTPLGAEIYYHQFDEVNKRIALCGGEKIEPHMPQVDKDGFTEFVLWQFIELYGEHISLGSPNVVSDVNFYISDDDLKEVKTE